MLSWETRKYKLINTYTDLNPDIIFVNNKGTIEQNAIVIKINVYHKTDDDIITNTLQFIVDTALCLVTIGQKNVYPIPRFSHNDL